MEMSLNRWRKSVISAGDGRGFVATDGQDRLCITAAHCLPAMPVAGVAGIGHTIFNLLGPIGQSACVAGEVRFVDPIADIAVIGVPDGQELFEEAEAYETLMNPLAPIPLTARMLARQSHVAPSGDIYYGRPQASDDGWLLGLDGEWFGCHLTIQIAIAVIEASKPIIGGMSGSPIISRGGAIGLVANSFATGGLDDHRTSGPSPYLHNDLPGWLARRVRTIPSPAL